jgi:uncharacterized membrane protein
MAIKMRCPHVDCAKPLRVPDEGAGKTGLCPACRKPIKIPLQSESEDPDIFALADTGPVTLAAPIGAAPRRVVSSAAATPAKAKGPAKSKIQKKAAESGPGPSVEVKIQLDVLGDAWATFKARWSVWVLAQLVFPACAMGLGVISSALLALNQFALGGTQPVTLIIQCAAFVSYVAIMALVLGGIYRLALHQRRGYAISVRDLLHSGASVPQLLLAVVLVGVATLAGTIFLIVPGLIVGGLFMFTIPLIVDGRLTAIEAMRRSFEVLKSQWLMATVFHVVLGIVSTLGLIFCFVGVFATAPLYPIGVAILYRRFFPGTDIVDPADVFLVP